MRLMIWILDPCVDDALERLVTAGFRQDLAYGQAGRGVDPGMPGHVVVAGDLPDDRLGMLDLIDGVEIWAMDFNAEPMTDAAPGEFVESRLESR